MLGRKRMGTKCSFDEILGIKVSKFFSQSGNSASQTGPAVFGPEQVVRGPEPKPKPKSKLTQKKKPKPGEKTRRAKKNELPITA